MPSVHFDPATGLGNPVTAVLLAYRALDTLLEKVVVLLALIGVWSLAPDAVWGGAPEVEPGDVPGPLAYLARILPPFGVVIGVYMFWVGADAPGGTFQAGTVLAAMWLLVMLAGLRAPPETGGLPLRLALAGGPVLFLAIAFLGFVVADGFLAYPKAWAKPLIVAIEAALTLSVAAASRPEGTDAMTAALQPGILFGLCGAALVGIGLFSVVTHPGLLRRIIGCNILGAGIFLVFGAVARRGGDAGFAADPVPQALVITGIVV
eukprot:gene34844-44670_t